MSNIPTDTLYQMAGVSQVWCYFLIHQLQITHLPFRTAYEVIYDGPNMELRKQTLSEMLCVLKEQLEFERKCGAVSDFDYRSA